MTYPEKIPLLWVGLGNPGALYRKTRHNLGYIMVDFFLERFGGSPLRGTRYAKTWDVMIREKKVIMAKPTTFMNLSGRAVRSILEETDLSPERMVVFHDDLDLKLGRTKLKWKGGDAGHKGIRSIIDHLHTDAFFRVRMGIGRPPEGGDVSEYVLSPFSRQELEIVWETAARVAEGMEIWAEEGTANALNFLNRRD